MTPKDGHFCFCGGGRAFGSAGVEEGGATEAEFGRRWVRAASPRALVLEGVSIFLSGVDSEGPRGGPMSSRSELVGQWLEQK